jgi:hypothetical protein
MNDLSVLKPSFFCIFIAKKKLPYIVDYKLIWTIDLIEKNPLD